MNPQPVILAQAGHNPLSFLHTMRGPDFLVLFAVWFLITFCGVWLFRCRDRDTPVTTLLGLACFEALGIARIMDGSAHGMHNWAFLILMMIIGGLIFFLRAEHFQNDGSNGSCSGGSSSCSSGGGCGGGGGGCGGCGGS